MTEASATHAPEQTRRLPPLHEIAAAMRAVLDVVDEAEGEVADADARMLDELGLTLGQKAEVIALVHSELLAASVAALAVAKPYLDRAKRLQAHAERQKDRMRAALELAGLDRVVGPTGGGARMQKNSQPTVVLDATKDVPIEWSRIEPDISRIGKALKAGQALDFATLETGSHLRWL